MSSPGNSAGLKNIGSRPFQGIFYRSYLIFPAFSLLILVGVWVSTALLIKADRVGAERAAAILTQELLATYEAQSTRAVREIDQTLKLIKYATQIRGQERLLPDLKTKGLLPPDLLFIVTVADGQGDIVASSRSRGASSTINRPFFEMLRQTEAMAVSLPQRSAGASDTSLQFGRKLTTSDGSFAGVVIVSVPADYFVSSYEPSKLGSNGVLAVLGVDGVFRAKRTGDKSSFGDVVDYATAAPDADLEISPATVVTNPWDGVRRYTSSRKLYDFPLTAIVGLSQDEQLAAHRHRTNAYLGWAAAGSSLLIFFAAVTGIMGWRLEKGRQRGAANRKAAEQSLRVAAAAFESQEAMIITDARGVILQVNKAFTATTGYSATDALGQTPRLLRSSRQDADFYRTMWDCIGSTGVWQGELWNRHKDGTEFPVWSNISAVKDANGDVTHYVGSHFDITARKHAERRINDLAYYDQLTGLPNRAFLMDRLSGSIASAHYVSYNAMLFIDLDNFKKLNDTLGHDMGDLLLKQVGQRLSQCVRAEDTVARFGGDEFVVLLAGLGVDRLGASVLTETVGKKILSAVNQPYQLKNVAYRCSSSIGATIYAGHQMSLENLMKQSDLAMYRAKAAGRNSFCFFDPIMESAAMQSAALEDDLRRAIDEKQFELHYQAQIVDDGRVVGAEALVRWHHPERGIVPPIEFIPLAEETGLILPLGHWVLEAACSQLRSWSFQPALAHLTVAVNVSARQFHQHDFVDQVLSVLDSTGANPRRLKLELTESLLVNNIDQVIEKMSALKAWGIGFSLDDFGTGYSSLSHLKRLPLDQLKIDKSFVRDVHSDPDDAAIVNTIVALANALDLAVIAEGVETESQRDFLVGVGCRSFQGYYFSRPLPIVGFEAYFQKHQDVAAAWVA